MKNCTICHIFGVFCQKILLFLENKVNLLLKSGGVPVPVPVTMNTDLSIYRSVFIGLIEADSSSIIENNSPAHAKIILQELVNHAEMSVYILCSHFCSIVYGDADLQAALVAAIDRGVSVNIAVRDKEPQEYAFFAELKEKAGKSGRFYTGVHQTEDNHVYANDFCVVDGKRFRLERDQEKGTAFVCANNEEIVGRLEKWFNISVCSVA